ncbi:hypothetical protein D3C73_1606880 [compost metagenome]
MLLNSGFNNCQTQTSTARFAIARFIGTIERTENLFSVFRAHARTIIVHGDGNPVFIHREAHFNPGV